MTRPRTDSCPQRGTDLYQAVTDRIIADLDRGVRPWTQPWQGGTAVSRPLRHNLEPYSGVNVLLLWAEAHERGFGQGIWMTFRQALSLGAHVRKGEHGATVVYANRIQRTETGDDGETVERGIPFLKAYTVFNIAQIENLPDCYRLAPMSPLGEGERIAAAECFFTGLGADIRHGGGMAYYDLAADRVQMPPFDRFHDAHGYYATLAHECVHWTRHPTRLDRDLGRKRFGDEGYAREELVAELGAAFLCADLGLALEPREDHAAYIASWLAALRNDRRLIFSASAHAQKACAYLADRARR